MAGALGLQFWLRRMPDSGPDPEALIRLFFTAGGLVQKIGAKFPPSIWATRALAPASRRPGLGAFLLFAGVSLLLVRRPLFRRPGVFLPGPPRPRRSVRPGRRRLSRERPVGPDLLGPKAGPGDLPPGTPDHEPDPDLSPQRRSLGRSDPGHLHLDRQDRRAGGMRHDPDPPPSGLGESGGRDPRLGPVHDDLRLPERDGLFGLFPGRRPSSGCPRSSPSPPADQVKAKFLHSFAIAGLGISSRRSPPSWSFRPRSSTSSWPPLALARGRRLLTALGMIIDLAPASPRPGPIPRKPSSRTSTS